MTITTAGADAVIADLEGFSYKAMRVAVRALNRAIVAGRTDMARAVASDTGLAVGDVTKKMTEQKANYEHLEAAFGAPLKRIPLIYFKARQTKTGVRARLTGGAGQYVHAFIATMKSSHTGVFARVRGKFMREQKPTWKKKRQAIRELWGPSLGHVFKKYQAQGVARTKEAFDTAFAHELKRLTAGMSSPSGTQVDNG